MSIRLTTTDYEDSEADTGPRVPAITDEPLADLVRWHANGERVCLITLFGVDGAAPRPVGAQMAVSETGKAAGYLSGGCLEQALILEAMDAIEKGENKLLRYGQGSPFIDIRLPCESGLDIYIDQTIGAQTIAQMRALIDERQPFLLKTDLEKASSTAIPAVALPHNALSKREGSQFIRICKPQTKILLFGSGPAANRLAHLIGHFGLPVEIFTPDDSLALLGDTGQANIHRLSTPRNPPKITADRWTAAILAFHEHEWDIPLLESLLHTDCFYIGAIGNRKVGEERLNALRARGCTETALSRIKNAAGVIKGAKSADALALGILTEIVASASG